MHFFADCKYILNAGLRVDVQIITDSAADSVSPELDLLFGFFAADIHDGAVALCNEVG